MPGNALFSVNGFLTFFLDLVSILAPFWNSEGHFGAVQIDYFQETDPRWSPRTFWIDLGTQGEFQEAFWITFETMWAHFVWVLEGLGEIVGGFGAQSSAQKYAVRCMLYTVRCTLYAARCLSQVGGIGR